MNKNYLKLIALLIVLLTGNQIIAQNITSFSPATGAVGTSVIITGTGFSTTPSANIVRFDNAKATVTGATVTSLTVTVPYGSTSYAEIKVTKGGLTRSSATVTTGAKYFKVTFPGGQMTPANYHTTTVNINGTADAVVSGDMNNDGLVDIVVTQDHTSNTDSLKVYRNNGNLTYTMISGLPYSIGANNDGVMSLADIDNDGDLDVVLAIDYNTTDIKFFTNNGTGALTALPGSTLNVGHVGDIVQGDFNNDGWVDFIFPSSPYTTYKAINNQNNTFTSTSLTTSAEGGTSGDFNNNGTIDIVLGRFSVSRQECFLGNGTGGFISQGEVAAGLQTAVIAKGDFNSDGNLDIAMSGYFDSRVTIALGNGNGTFGAPANNTAGSARGVGVADFDGDGNLDLYTSIYSGGAGFYLFKGSGSGTFNTPITVPCNNSAVTHNAASFSDFNNDGKPDLVTASNSGGMQIHYYTTPLSVTIPTSTSVTCNGGSNGSATSSVIGGFTPYTYSWTGGSTVANPTNLTAGTKTLTVTDALGATATATVTINQATAIVTSIASQTNVNCFGQATGAASLNTVTGGNAPYTYAWTPSGGTGTSITGRVAGGYSCTVTDNAGCTKTQTVTITQPAAALTSSISSQTNVTCNAGTNGAATVLASGGTTPYSYLWTPLGGTAATTTGRTAGTYTCNITDNLGCIRTQTVTLTQPTAITSSISSQTNILCNGAATGAATVLAGGGTTPYTYSWAPSGGTAATTTGRTAGTYTCTITDNVGCTKTQTVTLTQPTAITSSISSQTNVSCFGGNNGSATVLAGGGTTPYTYNWAPSGGTAVTANTLTSGTYTCTITDNLGCTKAQTVTISQPAALTSSISSQTNITCNAGANGAATVLAGGGTTPYIYSWAPSGGTAATTTGRTAGTYTCTITDNAGCTKTQTVTLTQPSAITSSISSQTNILCNGAATGAATVLAGGGITPYTYNWTPSGGTAATTTGRTAGTYTCTITDNVGCTKTQTVTLTQPTAITSSISSQTNVSCFGGNNGSATVLAGGGTTPYTYNWAPSGGTAATANTLTSGTYTCTITDNNGCIKTQTVTISQPAALASSISSQTNITCNAGANGTATVLASGGTTPYTYSWAPSGGTAASISGRVAGTYTCTITDNVGCIKTQTVTLTQPTAITSSISSQTNILCNGGATGAATVLAGGGTSPYTYNWTPSGGTAASTTGRTTGTYTCTITDNVGCTKTQTVTLTQPTALTSSISSQTNVLCNGGATGAATVLAGGGATPYTYNWSPSGGTAATTTGRTAGTYTCTITDNNGCIKTQTVTLTEPSAVTISFTTSNATCGSPNGSATAIPTGGAGGYTYQWNAAAGNQTTATATGLISGSYVVVVTDASGCTGNNSASVSNTGGPLLTTNGTNINCFGLCNGTAIANATGGSPPYTYQWSASAGNQTTQTATALCAGTHTVTVTDNSGCVIIGTRVVTQPSLASSSFTSTNVLCNGGNTGSATIAVVGGTSPYSYSWAPFGGTGTTASSLSAGTYTCTVTDANSCSTTHTIAISQPTALTATNTFNNVSCFGGNNGSITALPTGGTSGYTYSWAPFGGTAATASALTATGFTCTITDVNGCITTTNRTLSQPAALAAGNSQINATCNGLNNGSATVTPSGGTAPYSYNWIPAGGSAATATGLSAIGYTCNITDNNGCALGRTFTITQPAVLTAGTSQTDVSCNGGSNGTATVSVSGGTPGYSYSWSPSGGTGATASGLIAGTYTCTITDVNSCTISNAFTITQPTALSISSSHTNVSCNAGNNGTATVFVTGGTTSYSYNWTPGNPTGDGTPSISGLFSGIYNCTVTDANGCTINTNENVLQPTALGATTSQNNVSCNGGNNGLATVIPSGGTPGYTYNWTPSGGTGATASALAAGNYTCTITDINSCSIIRTFSITEPATLSVSFSSGNVSCNGGTNGMATATSAGGTSGYTYSWAPSGGTNATATGLNAGTYTCTVTDANSCVTSNTVLISQPTPLSATSSSSDATCNGYGDGSATVTPTGGTGAYTYSWAPSGGAGSVESSLFAGTYTCTVTDVNGCTTTNTVTINEPTVITTNIFGTNVSCFGGNNGTGGISAIGGTGAYTYNWTPSGGTNSTASGLTAGSYTCYVTDANACIYGNTLLITEPTVLTTTTSQTDVSCNGGTDGTVTISPTGGTIGYTYNWLPSGGTGVTETSLTIGTYTCTVTDANGCIASNTVSINEPAIISTSTAGSDVSCFGGNNGSASITASGGVGSFTYNWIPSGGTNATENSLTAGTYTCTVTDANGCTANDVFTVNEPTALSAFITQLSTAGCIGGSNGSLQIAVNGGVGPYFYTWSSGGTTDTETGLVANTYTCSYTDNNSCPGSATGTVFENNNVDLYGAITFPGGPINAGYAFAFKQQSSINGIDTVAVVPITIGAGASYTFSGLAPDNYYVKILLDTTLHPTAVPTYYGNAFQWDSSLVVTHGCLQIDTADIAVIELLPPGGTGLVSGYVIEGNGFGSLRINYNGNHPNLPFVPGGPLKGIDVKLGKNPAGGIQARIMTDSSGYYQFTNVPDGNYRIYVDIPNLPMDSLREVSINNGDTSVQNNYYADSLMIYIDTNQYVGIYSSAKEYENKFSIYPNPTTNMLNLQFTVEAESAAASFEISDAMGRVVYTIRKQEYTKGDNVISLKANDLSLKAGVYFVSILNENKRYTQRLIVLE